MPEDPTDRQEVHVDVDVVYDFMVTRFDRTYSVLVEESLTFPVRRITDEEAPVAFTIRRANWYSDEKPNEYRTSTFGLLTSAGENFRSAIRNAMGKPFERGSHPVRLEMEGEVTSSEERRAALRKATRLLEDMVAIDGKPWMIVEEPLLALMRIADNAQKATTSPHILSAVAPDWDHRVAGVAYFPLSAHACALAMVQETAPARQQIQADIVEILVPGALNRTWSECALKTAEALVDACPPDVVGLVSPDPSTAVGAVRAAFRLVDVRSRFPTHGEWARAAEVGVEMENPARVEETDLDGVNVRMVEVPFVASANIRLNRSSHSYRRGLRGTETVAIEVVHEDPLAAFTVLRSDGRREEYAIFDDVLHRSEPSVLGALGDIRSADDLEKPSSRLNFGILLAGDEAREAVVLKSARDTVVAAIHAKSNSLRWSPSGLWAPCAEPFVELRSCAVGVVMKIVDAAEIQQWRLTFPLRALRSAIEFAGPTARGDRVEVMESYLFLRRAQDILDGYAALWMSNLAKRGERFERIARETMAHLGMETLGPALAKAAKESGIQDFKSAVEDVQAKVAALREAERLHEVDEDAIAQGFGL